MAMTLACVVGRGAWAMQAVTGEWTLEDARKLWKPMVRPVQHVGLPG